MSKPWGPKVQGRCPNGCGETLFLGVEGYVTCSYLPCPDPEAATNLLEAATPPVPAAPVVPPEPALVGQPIKFNDLRCGTCTELPDSCECHMNLSDDERAGLLSALDDLHGPAVTDEPALAVIRDAIFHNSSLNMAGAEKARSAVVAALGANGYVVLPRKLLDELLDATTWIGGGYNGLASVRRLQKARRAVVEAVGPTREDTKA